MKKTRLIIAGLLLTASLILILIGCGSERTSSSNTISAGNGGPSAIQEYNPDPSIKAPQYPKTDEKTFKFLNVQVSLPVPQTYYMFDQGLLEKELNSTGYKAQEVLDDVHQKVLPNFYIGYYDFAYVPVNVLAEYWSGKVLCQESLWKSGDDYVIIAGAYDGGISLLTAPDIFDLKALDGKTVGIMNPSFNIEMQLNKMLGQVGLKTKATGGSVDVMHNFPGNVMNALQEKKVAGVFAWDMYKPQLKALGFQEIRTWDQMEYGKNSPYMVLAVRKDILKNHPEVVKSVLQAHIKSTQLALNENSYIKPLIQKYNKYVTGLDRQPRPEQTFDYRNLQVSYDPNYQYLKDTYDYIKNGKILKKEINFGGLINFTLLNEILNKEKLALVKGGS